MMPRSEEHIPAHRKVSLTWSSEAEARRNLERSSFCDRCGKLALSNEADARSYIGLLMASPLHRPRPEEHALRPYRCAHGNGWRVGRDLKTAELLRSGRHHA